MTMDALRERFRKDEDNAEAKQVCKVLVLAALAPSLFVPLTDLSHQQENQDDEYMARRRAFRMQLEAENIRRAARLAERLADAAFGGHSNGSK